MTRPVRPVAHNGPAAAARVAALHDERETDVGSEGDHLRVAAEACRLPVLTPAGRVAFLPGTAELRDLARAPPRTEMTAIPKPS